MNRIFTYLRSILLVPSFAPIPVARITRTLAILPLGAGLLNPLAAVLPNAQPHTVLDAEQIATQLTEDEALPIADVHVLRDADDTGIVVFLPQYHRYPGSKVEDTRNDPAMVTQQELYSVLREVVAETGVDTAFVEGEYTGAVADVDRQELATRVNALKTFEDYLDQMETVLAPHMTEDALRDLLAQAQSRADLARRGIVLAGAPERMWAEGADIVLYGTENLATREASADLVREHLYLQDQLKRVAKGGSLNKSFSGMFELMDLDTITALRQRMAQGEDGASSRRELLRQFMLRKQGGTRTNTGTQRDPMALLEQVKSALSSDADATTVAFVDGFEGAWESLFPKEGVSATPPSATKQPSRSQNPYRNVTDRNELQKLMGENEQQIEKVVIEQRNLETAQEVARVMSENGEEISVLQFGAGHEAGMIEALRAQNLSVITVIVDSVEEGRRTRGE